MTDISDIKGKLGRIIQKLQDAQMDIKDGMFLDCLEGNMAVIGMAEYELGELLAEAQEFIEAEENAA